MAINDTRDVRRFTVIDIGNLALLLAMCTVAMALLWCKLNYLVWLDPSWWLQEMFRFAHGQVPYKDYFWTYPPLTVMVFGWAQRVLGDKFWVPQVVLNIFSLAVMLGVYFWTRYLLPARLHLLTCFLVLGVCITTQTYFSLFSFLTYGPTMHVSATGLLILLLATLTYLHREAGNWAMFLCMSLGSTIALTSKLDSMVTTGSLFVALLLFDDRVARKPLSSWIRYYTVLGLIWFAPAALFYLLVGQWTGFANMALGIRANGLASVACPWWPTGFGVLAAAAALGLALLVGTAATLVDIRRWRACWGRRYWLLLAGGVAGGCVYFTYVSVLYPGAVFGSDPLLVKLRRLAPELLSTSAVFRPALWTMIVYWTYLLSVNLKALLQGRTIPAGRLARFLVLTIPVSISPRGLFGMHLTPYPEVPALCYPFVMVCAVYVLLRWLQLPYGPQEGLKIEVARRPAVVVTVLTLAYVAVRLIGGYPEILSYKKFTRLETPAGVIHVKDGQVSRELVNYVLANTAPTDSILEIPNGGGISFATGRPSLSFTTIWNQLPVPESIRMLDLQRLQTRPPRIVIGSSVEHLGSFVGVHGTNGCMFPALVWLPNRLSWSPGEVLPAIRWIEENYRIDRRIGNWVLLRPRN